MPVNWNMEVDVAAAAARGLRRAAEAVLDEAKSRAPVLSGDLRDSGQVNDTGAGEVSVSFTAPHAARQHYKDYEHPRGGERLFLKNAAEHMKPQIEQIVADEIRRSTGGS
ncbi:hypothetical protein SEA_ONEDIRECTION_10 [Gordonia phage OneDirection]|nr:hypothetical protein SEA_ONEDIRECTION_10 [Gordonia phage OneDirection]